MYQGFYNLASGMLTQSRNLNVVSNNMVNIQTAGYKKDKMVSSTFQEEMMYRTGKHYKEGSEALATTSKIRTAERTYVNYEQGAFDQTDGIYDFAMGDRGFFCIETPMGIRYTRNGSFSVDEEGYLTLNGMGRVLGTDGPIQIDNEDFTVDSRGRIRVAETEGGGEDGESETTIVLNRPGASGGGVAFRAVAGFGEVQCGYDGGDDIHDDFPKGAAECGSGAQDV